MKSKIQKKKKYSQNTHQPTLFQTKKSEAMGKNLRENKNYKQNIVFCTLSSFISSINTTTKHID